MRPDGYSVAIVGASTIAGRQVREVLRDRQFPVREWSLYDRMERFGEGDEGEDDVVVRPLEQARLDGVDLLFACDPGAFSIERPADCVVIDLTETHAERADVPLIVPEVNPDEVADFEAGRVLSSPVPGAIALAVVLKPVEEAAQIRRVVVSCYEPASSAGVEGVAELAQQSRELLGGVSPDDGTAFARRLAFNLIPQVGDFVGADKTRAEWLIESQTRRLLDLPDLPITATSVRVPTFFGHGYAINVETESPLDAAGARGLLRESPGVLLPEDEAGPYPTAADALETDAIYVGRVRDDSTVPCGLNLWVALDGSRKGGAVNAVQVAELLIRNYL